MQSFPHIPTCLLPLFFPSFPYPMATPSSPSFPPTPSLLKYQTRLSNFLQPFPAALPPAHRPAPRCARSSRSPPAQLPTEMPWGTAGAVEVPAAGAGASLLKLQKKKKDDPERSPSPLCCLKAGSARPQTFLRDTCLTCFQDLQKWRFLTHPRQSSPGLRSPPHGGIVSDDLSESILLQFRLI